MTDKPDLAPGCFGSAFYYGKHDICSVCQFGSDCEVQHVRAKAALREHFGVTIAPKRDSADLPVRVKAVFDELGVSAEAVKNALISGMNPYNIREGFMGVVCQLLLKKPGIERALVAKYLARFNGLNEATSDVYTRYAIQILSHCRAISLDGQKIDIVRG